MLKAYGTILFCALLLWAAAAGAVSITIWQEDFSDVSDWQIISDPGGGSTITSDGDLGALYVDKAANQAAFGPKIDGSSPFVVFDRDNPGKYSIHFTVDSLTASVSYDVAIDEFDGNTNFLATIWQVFPEASTSTFTGYTNVNLGSFSYHANTYYVLPKITVHTGEGAQTVFFDEMHFEEEQIPEPATAWFLALGLYAVLRRKRQLLILLR